MPKERKDEHLSDPGVLSGEVKREVCPECHQLKATKWEESNCPDGWGEWLCWGDPWVCAQFCREWAVDNDPAVPMERQATFWLIDKERKRQDTKFRRDPGGWHSPPSMKLAVLVEEIGEVARAIQKRDPANCKEEVVQVVALAVAWLESWRDEEIKDRPHGAA